MGVARESSQGVDKRRQQGSTAAEQRRRAQHTRHARGSDGAQGHCAAARAGHSSWRRQHGDAVNRGSGDRNGEVEIETPSVLKPYDPM